MGGGFLLNEGNYRIARVLYACINQWQYAGMSGQVTGINLQVVRDVARDMGVRTDEAFYRKVSAFEQEVLAIHMNNARGKETDDEYTESVRLLKQPPVGEGEGKEQPPNAP